MKNINKRGFVLAETLVVTVFLMLLFTMIYNNYYPIIGEYEKRETYDDVDGKYVAYWLKKLVEDKNYVIKVDPGDNKKQNMETYGYFRLECSDLSNDSQKRSLCTNLVSAYEINSCRKNGDNCDIYVTNYRIGGVEPDFKKTVEKNNLKKYQENCFGLSDSTCRNNYLTECRNTIKLTDAQQAQAQCEKEADSKVFTSAFQDYIATLPDYTTPSKDGANYRLIAIVHHTKDYNNYLSYSTIEVSR